MDASKVEQIEKLVTISKFFKEQSDEESHRIHGVLECLRNSIILGYLEELSEATLQLATDKMSKLPSEDLASKAR